jgi:hypothetical protein
MSWAHLDDPQRRRDRAAEARYVTQHMTDSMSSEMIFAIAAAYERLAKRAEGRRTSGSFRSRENG